MGRHGRSHVSKRKPLRQGERPDADQLGSLRAGDGDAEYVAVLRGDILGAAIAGAKASELIGIWTLALSKGLSLKDMASSMPPHPTMGEIGKSAAITYFAKRARRPLLRGMVRLLQLFG